MSWPHALCPDDAKQDPVVYGAEFGVVFGVWGSFPGEGSTYCIHTRGPPLPRHLPFGS